MNCWKIFPALYDLMSPVFHFECLCLVKIISLATLLVTDRSAVKGATSFKFKIDFSIWNKQGFKPSSWIFLSFLFFLHQLTYIMLYGEFRNTVQKSAVFIFQIIFVSLFQKNKTKLTMVITLWNRECWPQSPSKN